MNRGDIKSSTESKSGGMYSKDARVMCEINVESERSEGTVYRRGAEAPDMINARRAVRVKKIRKDAAKMRSQESKVLEEDQLETKQTSLGKPQQERAEEDMRAPVWWQLEVEGHSANRRNKNRVRRYLRKMLDHLEANEEIPEKVKRKERQRRRAQLEALQRP